MAKADHTKELIANALRQLVQEKHYSDITVADIVKQADISRHTFYYHFKDKQDLLQWIYLHARENANIISASNHTEDAAVRLMDQIQQNSLLYTQARYDTSQNGLLELDFQENYRFTMEKIRMYLGDRELPDSIGHLIATYFTWANTQSAFDILEGKINISHQDYNKTITMLTEQGLFATLDQLATPSSKNKP